jgi:predicted SprT family Zn-dependent metalloprotease
MRDTLSTFKKYFPEPAVAYAHRLWQYYAFDFRITKSRASKFGDYRFANNRHKITVNGDMNPYAFLVTYLHEVAHLVAFQRHNNHIQPHGQEWKAYFRELARPVLNTDVFPENVLAALKKYLQDAKASSCSDPELFQALHQFDTQTDKVLLANLPEGELFSLNGRAFRKGETRRTRVLCEEVKSRRKYLVHAQALVEKGV